MTKTLDSLIGAESVFRVVHAGEIMLALFGPTRDEISPKKGRGTTTQRLRFAFAVGTVGDKRQCNTPTLRSSGLGSAERGYSDLF